jgi:glycosyltransferase involved in cell wall biosynthesis
MRIAILNLTAGGMSGGYKKYLHNIIPRVASNPAVEALLCASPPSLNVQAWFEPLSNVAFVNCKPFRFMHHSPDPELKHHLEKFSPDVIFVPLERYFRFNNIPVVNMLQNMEPLVTNIDGNPFKERVRQWFQAVDAKRAIKRSDRVIATSEFVRDFIEQYWKIQPERISIAYHGIDLPKNKGQRPALIPKDWEGQFLFTAGSIRPARGLEDVLNALNHLFDKSLNTPGLVIAGETTSVMMKYKKKLEDWIKTHNLSSRVCWAGSLNENEMAWCYQNCRAFVMTSRAESFGFIAAEAMSHGCICISADNPCLPEIFGDAAIFYPPKDGKALADVIQAVLIWNNSQRKVMSERAKKRAAEFSWDVCAEKTVAVLAKAVEVCQTQIERFLFAKTPRLR